MKYLFILITLFQINQAIAQQTLNASIQYGGVTRDYLLYIPAAYSASGNKVPLVFNFHGYTSNSLEQLFYSNFTSIADTANFIMCLPNGTLDPLGNRFWNVGFIASNVDDVGFTTALLDTLYKKYNIDKRRVYSTGMSNGGFMSHRLACERNDRFAAIASVTGSMTPNRLQACRPGRPVPVMQIHGTDDGVVPYNGSIMPTPMSPVDSVIGFWTRHNGCTNAPVFTAMPNTSTADFCTAERYVYSACNNGTEVVLFKIIDGGHTWPGASFNIGVTNMDINASVEIWKFFNKYRHPASVLSSEATELATSSHQPLIYPNPAQGKLEVVLTHPDTKQIRIMDVLGNQLMTIMPESAKLVSINLDKLVTGTYFVEVVDNNGRHTQRFIKE